MKIRYAFYNNVVEYKRKWCLQQQQECVQKIMSNEGNKEKCSLIGTQNATKETQT